MPVKKDKEIEVENRPKMSEPEWTDWVLKQFEPHELEEGNPKVEGLQRMVRKLLGPIIKGTTIVKQTPSIDNEQRATVEYTVVILNKYYLEDGEEPYEMVFSDAADAYKGNVKGIEYARFPTAMAATRAKGRALRNALNLNVVASEEISDQPLEEAGLTGKITEGQINKIDIKCQQLDINFLKYINMGKKKYENVEDITHYAAIKMFELINEYQQEVKEIPKEIKGYEPHWRDQK